MVLGDRNGPRLEEARNRWLKSPDLVERVPEVVPGFPDRVLPRDAKAAAILKTRTLTNLYNTQGKPEGAWLDAAVAAAYGWPAGIAEDGALAALLALNPERASGQRRESGTAPAGPAGPTIG